MGSLAIVKTHQGAVKKRSIHTFSEWLRTLTTRIKRLIVNLLAQDFELFTPVLNSI